MQQSQVAFSCIPEMAQCTKNGVKPVDTSSKVCLLKSCQFLAWTQCSCYIGENLIAGQSLTLRVHVHRCAPLREHQTNAKTLRCEQNNLGIPSIHIYNFPGDVAICSPLIFVAIWISSVARICATSILNPIVQVPLRTGQHCPKRGKTTQAALFQKNKDMPATF